VKLSTEGDKLCESARHIYRGQASKRERSKGEVGWAGHVPLRWQKCPPGEIVGERATTFIFHVGGSGSPGPPTPGLDLGKVKGRFLSFWKCERDRSMTLFIESLGGFCGEKRLK